MGYSKITRVILIKLKFCESAAGTIIHMEYGGLQLNIRNYLVFVVLIIELI